VLETSGVGSSVCNARLLKDGLGFIYRKTTEPGLSLQIKQPAEGSSE